MQDRKLLGEAAFAVTARVALQLGRESISSSIVAILELVKNAYDADAENVLISFHNLGTDTATLIIDDDGDGMTKQQLEGSWMVIGTDSKRNLSKSLRKRRVLTGEKGLGRLGLDRLCSLTYVQSFTEQDENGIELEIDWRKYEDTSERLEKIKHNLYSILKYTDHPISGETEFKKKGTRLVLVGLKDDWVYDSLLVLRQELALLVSPFGAVNDFNIQLDSGQNLPNINGRVYSTEGLDAAEWKVASEISIIDGVYNVQHQMTSPLYESTFSFGPVPWQNVIRDTGVSEPRCGSLSFEFYFMNRDLEGMSLSRSQIDQFLDSNQGIRIYRDGFRVKPYGEPSGTGDWLNLSMSKVRSPGGVRRSLGAWRVGYNQVVGAVFIGREKNEALIDQTNREGIVEGSAFFDLRRFALHAITFFQTNRQVFEKARGVSNEYESARESAESATTISLNTVEQLRSALDAATGVLGANTTLDDLPESAEIIRNISTLVDEVTSASLASQLAQQKFIRASEEQQEELQRQKDTLGNLASLGILAAAFGHETLGAATLVRNNTVLLQRNIRELMFPQPEVHSKIALNLEDITAGTEQIETFARFTIGNVSKDKRNRKKMFLKDVVDGVLRHFRTTLEIEKRIRIIEDYADNIPPILAFRIDWESIIINLLTNAVWALEDTPSDYRQIRIRIYESDGVLCLAFADSGRGLESGTELLVFSPTFSTKRNERGDVIGTGMGLAIIKNLIEVGHGGTVEVVSPSDIGGAEFRILVPIPKLDERGKQPT